MSETKRVLVLGSMIASIAFTAGVWSGKGMEDEPGEWQLLPGDRGFVWRINTQTGEVTGFRFSKRESSQGYVEWGIDSMRLSCEGSYNLRDELSPDLVKLYRERCTTRDKEK